MALNHSPSVVTNGLVYYHDMTNTQKSWKGAPTTNLYTDGDYSSGALHPVRSGTWAIVEDPRDSTKKVLKATPSASNQYHGKDITSVVSTVYSLQMQIYVSTDFNGTLVSMYPEQGGGGAARYYDLTKKGTWQSLKYDGISASTTNIRMLAYVLSAFTTGYVLISNTGVEQNAFATPFVAGTRSNTQAIVDLTNTNTVTATSLTYASDGTFSFNGSSDRVISSTTTFNRTTGQELTVSCWVKPSRLSGQYQIICESRSENAATLNWAVYQHTTDGAISFHGSAQNKSSYIPSTSAWVFVTNTVTTAGVSTLYVNGISNSVVTGYTYGGTPSYFSIGANGNGTEPFLGSIPNVQIYNRALSAAEVLQNFNALRGRYFGYQQLTYTASSNVTLTNNGTQDVSMFKNADNNVWNGEVRSTEVFTAPCTIEFSKQAASGDNGASYAMIGWNEDPTTNTNYTSLDHASYPYRTDSYSVYNNGSQVLFTGTWDVNKRFYIVYDTDGFIRHYNGSTLLYSANYGTNKNVYVDSSFYSVNSTFGGFSNVKVARSSWNGTSYV